MINWGIIGFGKMGRIFLECFKNVDPKINLVGFASNTNSGGKKFENKNLIKFNSYEELIKSNKIDAIYISTLNNTHKGLVELAAKNKKKILCEKPLGLNYNEVIDVSKALENQNDTFFEAITYRAHPQTSILKEVLSNKEIGKIKKIDSNFGFKIKKINKDSRLFKKEFGGGSILDLGCYPISFFNLFSNKENEIKILNIKKDYCETNVDVDAKINLKLNENIEAFAHVSFKENLRNICKIYCDNATIIVPEPWIPSKSNFIEVQSKSRYYKKMISSSKDCYTIQLNNVSDVFMGQNSSKKYLIDIKESLQISKILDLWSKN